ncbi:MAG: hypothetical protein ACRD68_07155 [Pyrinomonadaceae bacterium]
MRKLFVTALMIFASFTAAVAQQNGTPAQGAGEVPNMGRAPQTTDGIGRLDLRIVDENGNPLQGVRADLESKRSNGLFCESWNFTDARGVAVLPPLHMGRLMLKLKAPGFETQKIQIDASSLGEPVRVTMVRKK